MEDLNTIAADCLVISCCCQCLILQILIIILLKLPYKLFRKAISYTKKKLRNRRKRGGKINLHTKRKRRLIHDNNSPFRTAHDQEIASSSNDDHDECQQFESCMDEIEKVLEDFCLRGEFGFGRFLGGGDEEGSCVGSFPTCLGNGVINHQELDYDVVSYHLIQMFGSCNVTDQSLIH
ncbi:OLC1v1032448C1 [Oldenlandia corymbosa var. corymbosa]|uniref:OLC1v1032448C1 n=1 Tax=Oldenlandia corymbosa var. corymbosa TaxID=529605 RepID=A0AAV1CMN1_OLDCO|nr:OLC1v1032448C1 [Oldenlandia corymbosa var. corymbosa]